MISTVIACIVLFLLGYYLGILQKGIHINITHKQEEKPKEPVKYNESMAGHLPPEVQEYYKTTQGFNKY